MPPEDTQFKPGHTLIPKGNQYAVQHGRPHNADFSDEECVKLGEELVAWMAKCDKDPKCNVVHLSEWYGQIKRIDPVYWRTSLAKRPCFSTYYHLASEWMGCRTMRNTKLSTSYGSLFLPKYFKQLPEDDNEIFEKQEDYKAKKRKETEQVVADDIKDQVNSLLAVIKQQQTIIAQQRQAPKVVEDQEESDE